MTRPVHSFDSITANRRQNTRRRASVLLLVLVSIVIMTLTTSSYLLLMRNEHLASRYSGNHLQAEMLAQSGIDYLSVFLAQTQAEIALQGGLLSNPQSLQDVLVIDDELANYRGRFTILAPDLVQGYYQNVRYGLENESSKLNLNSLVASADASGSFGGGAAGGSGAGGGGSGGSGSSSSGSASDSSLEPRDRLMLVPGMNEEVADAILDWMDDDDDVRTYGAEADHYQSLVSPYLPANGPIRHLDELLLVRGVTPELLYGLDANRNYLLDPDEQPYGALAQLDNTTGHLNRGWSAYLTVQSSEKNLDPDGEDKLDVNSEDLQTLHGELLSALGPAEANFIIAFRQFGAAEENTNGDATSADSVEIDFEKEAQSEIGSLLDLVDAKVSLEGEQGKPAELIESPWTNDPASFQLAFAELLDVASSGSGDRIAGRININQASRPVLLTVPGMTDVVADQIIARREPAVDLTIGDQRHPTWLLADGLMELEEFRPMFPLLTTGGDVYSCQIVGFFDGGTARSRAHVVLDRSEEQTKLLAWQDLSKLGPGFARSVLTAFVEEQE